MSRAPILDPAFRWIPAATHDADSTLFRERQRARMRAAQELRDANTTEAARVVRPIAKARKT